MMRKERKDRVFEFKLTCWLPFLQSDIYSSGFKKRLDDMYIDKALDYAQEHGYTRIRFVGRYDSPYGHGTDYNFEAYK